ncbi:MAG: hypothetical protein AAB371_00505 [Patescibacteria group bacterium]
MKKETIYFIFGIIISFFLFLSITFVSATSGKWTVFKTDNSGFNFKNNSSTSDSHISISSIGTTQNSGLSIRSQYGFASLQFLRGLDRSALRWSIFQSASDTADLNIARYDANGNYINMPLTINRATGKIDINILGLSPVFSTPPSTVRGTMFYDVASNRIGYYNDSGLVDIIGKIDWNEIIFGTQTGWACKELPLTKCANNGCKLKIKAERISDKALWTYSGIMDYNTDYATFSSEADSARMWQWKLNDGVYQGSGWSHNGMVWVGDCQLNSSGGCTAGTNDKMNICGYQKFKVSPILIQY